MPGLWTITVPPTTARLTTTEAARFEVGVTDFTKDAFLSGLIDRASAVIASYCNRTWGVQTISEIFRFGYELGLGPAAQTVAPYGTPLNLQRKPLILQFPPVTNLVSVLENSVALDPAVPDYEIDLPAGLIWRMRDGYRGWWNVPTVVITYSAGYVLPDDTSAARTLPFEVEDACLALVKSAYFSAGRDPNVAMDWVEGGGRTQYWDRSVSPMAIDEAMAQQIGGYIIRAF